MDVAAVTRIQAQQGREAMQAFPSMSDKHQAFIQAQQMYFVGSAPLSAEGHVNLSPKGVDSFRILGTNRVAYLDLTGSGNETSAHLRENGRITFMFCAFKGAPLILRLYGHGEVALPGSNLWAELRPLFGEYPGARQIVVVEIDRVQTSCGYGVPFFDYVGQRETIIKWADAKGEDGIQQYWAENNVRSLDGLPTPMGEAFE
jgi:hypothetical protein